MVCVSDQIGVPPEAEPKSEKATWMTPASGAPSDFSRRPWKPSLAGT